MTNKVPETPIFVTGPQAAADSVNGCALAADTTTARIIAVDDDRLKEGDNTTKLFEFPTQGNLVKFTACLSEKAKLSKYTDPVDHFSGVARQTDLAHYLNQMQGHTNEMIMAINEPNFLKFIQDNFDVIGEPKLLKDGKTSIRFKLEKGNIKHLIAAQQFMDESPTEDQILKNFGVDGLNFYHFIQPFKLENFVKDKSSSTTLSIPTELLTDYNQHVNNNFPEVYKQTPTYFTRFLEQGGMEQGSELKLTDLKGLKDKVDQALTKELSLSEKVARSWYSSDIAKSWYKSSIGQYLNDSKDYSIPPLEDQSKEDLQAISSYTSGLISHYEESSLTIKFTLETDKIKIPVRVIYETRADTNGHQTRFAHVTITDTKKGNKHTYISSNKSDYHLYDSKLPASLIEAIQMLVKKYSQY